MRVINKNYTSGVVPRSSLGQTEQHFCGLGPVCLIISACVTKTAPPPRYHDIVALVGHQGGRGPKETCCRSCGRAVVGCSPGVTLCTSHSLRPAGRWGARKQGAVFWDNLGDALAHVWRRRRHWATRPGLWAYQAPVTRPACQCEQKADIGKWQPVSAAPARWRRGVSGLQAGWLPD